MKKEIKKWGDSRIIVLTAEECRIYGNKNIPLKVGDIIDLEIVKVGSSDLKKQIWEANQDLNSMVAMSE